MHHTAVLLVEDDPGMRSALLRGLTEAGFSVTVAENGQQALEAASGTAAPHGYDVLAIDIGLPDADGRDVCRALRRRGIATPALFLSARDELGDRLSAFDAGGDDYLIKPFHFDELVARLRALARRPAPVDGDGPAAVEAHGVRVDARSHLATCAERDTPLTPTELRLLAALLGASGTTLRRAELVLAGWSEGAIVHDNTLDQYIARLRRKLRELGAPVSIETVRGVGYRLG